MALAPFIIFIIGFLGIGLLLSVTGNDNPFGAINPVVITIAAIIISIIFTTFKSKIPYSEQVSQYLEGMGRKNVLIMCVMFLLAGAFNEVCKNIGAVNSMVNLGISVIPVQFLVVGCFVIASFMSVAIGTSMGTIISVAPIASGLAVTSGINESMIVAAVIGGAMLGDNLSVISGTNIAATESIGVSAKDKFRANLVFSIIAFVITTVVYIMISGSLDISADAISGDKSFNLVHMIPYLVVIIGSSIGLDVFIVLLIGILCGSAIGLIEGSITIMSLSEHIYNGFANMTEVFLLTMFMGGIAYFVEANGGIDYLKEKISKVTKSATSTLFAILGMGLVTDAATANNTVSVLAISNLGKSLGERFNISKALIATLLSVSTCVMQGVIPYGAQILLAKKLTQSDVSTMSLTVNNYYCWILLAVSIVLVILKGMTAKKEKAAVKSN